MIHQNSSDLLRVLRYRNVISQSRLSVLIRRSKNPADQCSGNPRAYIIHTIREKKKKKPKQKEILSREKSTHLCVSRLGSYIYTCMCVVLWFVADAIYTLFFFYTRPCGTLLPYTYFTCNLSSPNDSLVLYLHSHFIALVRIRISYVLARAYELIKCSWERERLLALSFLSLGELYSVRVSSGIKYTCERKAWSVENKRRNAIFLW